MPKFMVTGTATVSCYTIVEADTPEQAAQIAEERQLAHLTIQAFTADDTEAWHAEMDGEVGVERVEEQE